MDPYDANLDPEYRDTPIVSPIPKPSLETCPCPPKFTNKSRYNNNQQQQPQQQHYNRYNYHHQQQYQPHHNSPFQNNNYYNPKPSTSSSSSSSSTTATANNFRNSSSNYQQNSQQVSSSFSSSSSQQPPSHNQSYNDYKNQQHKIDNRQQEQPKLTPPSSQPKTTKTTTKTTSTSTSTLSHILNSNSNQNQSNNAITLPTEIQIPKPKIDSISCKIEFSESKNIDGLNMIVGSYSEPDYDLFCNNDIVENLNSKKSSLNDIPHEKFTAARSKANPYEKIENYIFINRSAIKLACLDALFSFTRTKRYDPVKDLVFWFADLCGGPGGFAEYLLWRKNSWSEKVFGWGITLTGDRDYDLDRFRFEALVRDCFKNCYGADGTGDLYNEENIKNFAKVVMEGTDGVGVDLVTADGSLNFRGKEGLQEHHSKQLLLCQVIAMFKTLKKNGDFVMKLFDIFTPFTGGIVWILYRYFEQISIIKPLASRPANSERYIICRSLKQHNPSIVDYLFDVNKKFNDLKKKSSKDQHQQDHDNNIIQIVDLNEINKDEDFVEFLKMRNMKIAIKQTEAIEDILKYVNDPNLKPPNQDEYKRLCLLEWGLSFDEFDDEDEQQEMEEDNPYDIAY